MKRKLACLGLMLLLLMSTISFASASTANTTERYDVDVEVMENHVFHVTETIKVDFNTEGHGIFRYIPYNVGIYSIENISVEDDPYETESLSENGLSQQMIKIGDADVMVSGEHTYTIHYDIVGYRDETVDQDYFSLDLLPTEWSMAIQSANITIHFPKAIDTDEFQLYSGSYGFEGNEGDIQPAYNPDTYTMTIKASDLYRGQGITLNGNLPEGYWVNPANRDWMIWPIMGVLIGLPILMFILWLLFGRDPKLVKTVEFYPPEGMTPAEIGYLVDGTIDQKDISSMILYYAEKGYLSIHEYKKGKFELVKECSIAKTDEKSFAKRLFNGLFANGDRVKMDKLPDDFGDYIATAKEKLKYYYHKERKIYKTASRVCRIIGCGGLIFLPVLVILLGASKSFDYLYMIAALPVLLLMLGGIGAATSVYDKWNSYGKGTRLGMMLLAAVLFGLGIVVTAAVLYLTAGSAVAALLVPVSMIVTMVFVVLMNARTQQAMMWLGQILGFRDFIETAELEKLKLMVEENPSYFYNIMPYAYVFGLSDKWAKHFELIESPAPKWYSGYGHVDAWDIYWYSRMCRRCLNDFSSEVNTAVIAAASEDIGGGSIGGGFGGGGFSGGGFGGGGGGTW